MLKHTKLQFSIGKRTLDGGAIVRPDPYWAPKIASVPTPAAHQMVAGLAFQPHSGQKAVLRGSNALHSDFIAHKMLKSWNH